MNENREIRSIKEFKSELHKLELEQGMYHDYMYDAGDDSTLRDVYYSKMIQTEAEIEALKSLYPEYIL
jgi:hypothetical protein